MKKVVKETISLKQYEKDLKKYSTEQLEALVEAHAKNLNNLATKAAEYSTKVKALDTKEMPLDKKKALGIADMKVKTTASVGRGIHNLVKGVEEGHKSLEKQITKNKNEFDADTKKASIQSESIKKTALVNLLVESVGKYNEQFIQLENYEKELSKYDSPKDVELKLRKDLDQIEKTLNQVGTLLKTPNISKKLSKELVNINRTLNTLKVETEVNIGYLVKATQELSNLQRLPREQGITQHMKTQSEDNLKDAAYAGSKRHDDCSKRLDGILLKLEDIKPKLEDIKPTVSAAVTERKSSLEEKPTEQPASVKTDEKKTLLRNPTSDYRQNVRTMKTDPEVTTLLKQIEPVLKDIAIHQAKLRKDGSPEAQVKWRILAELVTDLNQSTNMKKVDEAISKLYSNEGKAQSQYDVLNTPRGLGIKAMFGIQPTSAGLVKTLENAVNEHKPQQPPQRLSTS